MINSGERDVIAMNIHLVAKDRLESEGIRWIVETHFTGVHIKTFDSLEAYIQQFTDDRPDLLLLDMDAWERNSEGIRLLLEKNNICWLGISSERIFQTAYRGLRFRAEDVFFRPFPPADLIKKIQQILYQLRNEQRKSMHKISNEGDDLAIDYPDFFLVERMHSASITMVAILTRDIESLPLVYDGLRRFPFKKEPQLFALFGFILCVHETGDTVQFQEEYHAFLARWKEEEGEPLAIVSKSSSLSLSPKTTYLQTKELTAEIFFEGYDIILSNEEPVSWSAMDPFLTPVEQREWIEMLEKRDAKGIKDWVEHEFLTYKRPYPNPEIVRVRLTSVLAQVRRYMKSYNIQTDGWEEDYYAVFQQVLQSPIIYEIVQKLLAFITLLISDQSANLYLQEGEQTLVEKTRALIEANYWDTQWGLAACADSLRINKSTLSRRFSIESGQSFRIVLHQVRIGEAKRLLQETDLPIGEIAELVGYTHQSYFTEKFRQYEKSTPSTHRTGVK